MTAKSIHRFWDGPTSMPDRYYEYGRKWRNLNPGWRLLDWSVESVEQCMSLQNIEVWNHVKETGGSPSSVVGAETKKYTQLADIAAYEIIHDFGGVYVNCDMEPVRPLSDLPVDVLAKATASQETGRWVNNGFLSGPARSPFWKMVLDALPGSYWNSPEAQMNVTTGPGLLTPVHDAHPGELTVLDKRYFNYVELDYIPYGSTEMPNELRQQAIDAGAVVLHHWQHRGPEFTIRG